MHLTQDDSVWLLSSATIRAPPVNVNRSASVVETPTTSSVNSALNFIIAKWRPAEAWKKVFWMTLLLHLQHRLWVLHREQPTFVFHISQPVGAALLHIVWWCCLTADCHTRSSLCHPRATKRELCDSGKHLKFSCYYSSEWVSAVTRLCSLWHRVRNIFFSRANLSFAQ